MTSSNDFSLKPNIAFIWVFRKIMVSPIFILFNRVFHYKPSILGYPYFWKHPYAFIACIPSSENQPHLASRKGCCFSVNCFWSSCDGFLGIPGVIVLPSWWLNRPSEKHARQIGSFPQVGLNIKNIWNHHLVTYYQPKQGTIKRNPPTFWYICIVWSTPKG